MLVDPEDIEYRESIIDLIAGYYGIERAEAEDALADLFGKKSSAKKIA